MKLYLTDAASTTGTNFATAMFTALGTSVLEAEDQARAYEYVIIPPAQVTNSINALADSLNYTNSTTHIGGQSMYSSFTSYVQSSTNAGYLTTYLGVTVAQNAVNIPDLKPGDVLIVANNLSNTTGQFIKITRSL